MKKDEVRVSEGNLKALRSSVYEENSVLKDA